VTAPTAVTFSLRAYLLEGTRNRLERDDIAVISDVAELRSELAFVSPDIEDAVYVQLLKDFSKMCKLEVAVYRGFGKLPASSDGSKYSTL
jgi:hypothetical protein